MTFQGEKYGTIPTQAWKFNKFKNDRYQRRWLDSDTVNIGIGQGFNQYTPIQMINALSIIANEGKIIAPPHLMHAITSNNKIIHKFIYKETQAVIPQKYFIYIKQVLHNVIMHGTGRFIGRHLKYSLAGKTGTAQLISRRHYHRLKREDRKKI